MREIGTDECEGMDGGEWGQCPECGVRLKCKSLTSHMESQHNARPRPLGGGSAGRSWLTIGAVIMAIALIATGLVVWDQQWPVDDGGSTDDEDATDGGDDDIEPGLNYTIDHTVLCEVLSATWCPPCVIAEDNLLALYSSGEHDFVFLTLIADVEDDAASRMAEYGTEYYPTAEFDGGVRERIGVVDQTSYLEDIEHCDSRSVPDVRLTVAVETVTTGYVHGELGITYNGTGSVSGRLIVYVVERESRYDNTEGEPIPNGVMGFERDVHLTLVGGEPMTSFVTWPGTSLKGENVFLAAAFFDDHGRAVQAAASD